MCVCLYVYNTEWELYLATFFSLLLVGCFLFTVKGFLFTKSVLESEEQRPAAEFQSVGITPQYPHGN